MPAFQPLFTALQFFFFHTGRSYGIFGTVIAELQGLVAVRHFVAIGVPLDADVDVRLVIHRRFKDKSLNDELEGRIFADESAGAIVKAQFPGPQTVNIALQELKVVVVRPRAQQHACDADLYGHGTG